MNEDIEIDSQDYQAPQGTTQTTQAPKPAVKSLTEILKDPNYVNANEATKSAIFEKHSALDPNYSNANEATKAAIRQKFGLKGPEEVKQRHEIIPGTHALVHGVGDVLEAGASIATKAVAGTIETLAPIANKTFDFIPGAKTAKTALGISNAPMQEQAQQVHQKLDPYTIDAKSGTAKAITGGIGEVADATIGNVARGIGKVFEYLPGNKEENKWLGEQVPQLAMMVITPGMKPGMKTAIKESKNIMDKSKAAMEASQKEAAAVAQQKGYVIPPSQANPTLLNRTMEGVSGKVKTAQEASIKNQSNTNNLVRQALGIEEGAQLTPELMKAVRSKAAESYDSLRAYDKPLKATEDFHKAIDTIGNTTEAIAVKFPDLVKSSKELQILKDSLKVESMTANEAIELSKILREKASDHLSPMASGESKALGRAYRSANNAIESMIEANLKEAGNPELLHNFQNSRQVMAKSYTVEKALNEAGNVDANKLAASLKKGTPLSGELKFVAETAGKFGKAMKTPEQVGSHTPIDALDILAGIGGAAAHPAYGLTIFARPAVRKAILSERFQKNMAKQKAPKSEPKPLPKKAAVNTALSLASYEADQSNK
jgi:hypothetical protein